MPNVEVGIILLLNDPKGRHLAHSMLPYAISWCHIVENNVCEVFLLNLNRCSISICIYQVSNIPSSNVVMITRSYNVRLVGCQNCEYIWASYF